MRIGAQLDLVVSPIKQHDIAKCVLTGGGTSVYAAGTNTTRRERDLQHNIPAGSRVWHNGQFIASIVCWCLRHCLNAPRRICGRVCRNPMALILPPQTDEIPQNWTKPAPNPGSTTFCPRIQGTLSDWPIHLIKENLFFAPHSSALFE